MIFLIALGANLPSRVGSPAQTLEAAIGDFSDFGFVIRDQSRFFETPCFPAGTGPDYVNAAVSVEGDFSPSEILKTLHKVEFDHGRARIQRWGQRSLDLDLIAAGDLVLPDTSTVSDWINLPLEDQINATPPELLLPHPRIQDRAFVLVPLAEIAPDWFHPILNRTVKEMLARLPESEVQAVKPLVKRGFDTY